MLKGRLVFRFITGFAIVAVSALTVAAGTFWSNGIVDSVQELFGLTPPSSFGTRPDTFRPDLATNGPIIFQRGISAAFDIPYNRGGQLYRIDPSNGTENPFGEGSQPNYSFDGSKIVFLRNAQLTTSPTSSYTPTGLTLLGGGSNIIGLYPKYSPSGNAIAYNSTASINSLLYYHTKIISGNCAVCDTTISTHDFNPTGPSSYLYPSWNPLPTAPVTAQVVFVRTSAVKADVDSGNFTGDIYTETFTVNADGTITEGQRQFVTNSPAHYAFPVYSHDATKIVFIKFNTDGTSSLNVMNANGTNPTVLVTYPSGSSAAHHPAWSPDDTSIAFTDTDRIYRVAVNSNQVTAVTSSVNADYDLWPTWAPGAAGSRTVRAVSVTGQAGQQVTVSLELDSQGDEAAASFTVNFDPSKLSNPIASIGSGVPPGSSLGTNVSQVASGRIGILIDSTNAYSAGTRQMLTLKFNIAQSASAGTTAISFGNTPTTQSVSNILGATLSTTYQPGNITITRPPIDLQVNVTDSPDPVVTDATVTYFASVTNNGQTTAPNVKGNVAIPDASLFIASGTSSGCVRIGTTRNVECSFGNITPGDSVAKQITVRPTGGSSLLTFDISVTNSGDTSNIRSAQTTTVTSGSRPANDNLLSCSSLPPSPNCPPGVTGAIQLSGMSGTINGSNVGATKEIPINYGLGRIEAYELNHANVNGGKSIWYFWTPPANGTGRMVIDTSGSNFDTLLAVYSQGTGPSDLSMRKELVSNNDVSEYYPTSASDTSSQVFFPFDSQHVYYIVVDGKQGATGNVKLNWRATLSSNPPVPVPQRISIGIFPSIACTANSNASDICDGYFDPSGYFVLRIRGQNFTSDSQVLIKGISVTNMQGFDRAGNPVNGQLSRTGSTELQARIPPNPPLTNVALGTVRVVTRRAGAGPDPEAVQNPDLFSNGLPNGTYDTAFGSRGLQTFEAQMVVIPPGATRTICLNLAGNGADYETCIEFRNTGASPITLSPSFFASYSTCLGVQNTDQRIRCIELLKSSTSVAVNGTNLFEMSVKIKKRVDLTPDVVQAIRDNNGRIAIGFEGGRVVAGIVAQGGGNLITNDGGSLITNDGGSLITNDGGSLITNDGGSVISNDGASLITNDGGSLIGNDGASFTSIGGQISRPGVSRPAPSFLDVLAGRATGLQPTSETRLARASTAAANSSGVGGIVLARSSGGQEATFTTETDPVTGETAGYVSVTLDDSSFPKASQMNGMVFTVLVNPPVVQFASNNLTVNKAGGSAIATINRTGDTSGGITVEYKTQNDTANDRSDYSPVSGSVTFAPGETTKQISIPIIKHGYGTVNYGATRKFNLVIVNVIGGPMEVPNFTTITVTNDDPADLPTNPLDNADAQFFVRQQYLDSLGREPTVGEMSAGAATITQCGSDQTCVRTKRTDLSYSLFRQYYQAAAYVLRLYRATYGNNQPFPNPDTLNLIEAKKWLSYAAFVRDRAVIGDGANLAPTQLALANAFVLRPEFVGKYPTLTFPDGPSFVDAVLTTIRNDSGIDLASQRTALIGLFDQAGDANSGRAAVMYRLAEESQTNPVANRAFVDAEYNRAFAASLYFAYLKNDGSLAGLNSRKSQLDAAPPRDAPAQKALIDALVASSEYKIRFGLAPATNLTVGGRVQTPTGQLLRNAVVSLIDDTGVRRTATTSSFGLYSFSGVTSGRTYTLTVASKRYRFAARVTQFADSVSNLDFIGLE